MYIFFYLLTSFSGYLPGVRRDVSFNVLQVICVVLSRSLVYGYRVVFLHFHNSIWSVIQQEELVDVFTILVSLPESTILVAMEILGEETQSQ